MRRFAKAAAIVLAAALVIWVSATAVSVGAESGDLEALADLTGREYVLSDREVAGAQLAWSDRIAGSLEYDGMRLSAETEYEFSLEMETAGRYWIAAVYAAYEDNAFENQAAVSVNGSEQTVALPFLWADTCETGVDRYGTTPRRYRATPPGR